MLDEIVARILTAADDVRIVGRASGRADLIEVTRAARPDVVIMGMTSRVAEPDWELYAIDPMLRVLGLEGEGKRTYAYELRPHREPLGELSSGDLMLAVRKLARSRSVIGVSDGAAQ